MAHTRQGIVVRSQAASAVASQSNRGKCCNRSNRSPQRVPTMITSMPKQHPIPPFPRPCTGSSPSSLPKLSFYQFECTKRPDTINLELSARQSSPLGASSPNKSSRLNSSSTAGASFSSHGYSQPCQRNSGAEQNRTKQGRTGRNTERNACELESMR